MQRIDRRKYDELREVNITRNYLKHPQGSALIEIGETKVICTAMIDDKVPTFLKGTNTGWITAEYSMLPGSTMNRKVRDSFRGKIEGRSQEIQRFIGRALRNSVKLDKIGERTIWIDCDVIQADGGTRTASITGAYVALVEAMNKLYVQGELPYIPITHYVSAISVGIFGGVPILDLCYIEDYKARVDMNIAMNDRGEFIEIQGTGEKGTFTYGELNEMLNLAKKGNEELIRIQKRSLGDIGKLIGQIPQSEGE